LAGTGGDRPLQVLFGGRRRRDRFAYPSHVKSSLAARL
jgi:hypothetical protein